MKIYIIGIEISINLNSKFENFRSFFLLFIKKKCWSFRILHSNISLMFSKVLVYLNIFISQVPSKEQVDALSKELRSRASVPGSVAYYLTLN